MPSKQSLSDSGEQAGGSSDSAEQASRTAPGSGEQAAGSSDSAEQASEASPGSGEQAAGSSDSADQASEASPGSGEQAAGPSESAEKGPQTSPEHGGPAASDAAPANSQSAQPTQAASHPPAEGDHAGAASLWRQSALAGIGGLALAIVLWGGYSHRWAWTGINGHSATLWDWLHLLLLPLVFSVLPIWFNRNTRVHPRTKAYAFTGLAVFAVLVVLGYAIPWKWTGFRGNTLWDWLGLIVLPVTLILMPRFRELRREDWQARHSALSGTLLAVFVVIVLGGYLDKWTWTGFTGNRLWNWMHLLLLPLLIPTVILPMLKPRALGRVMKLDKDGKPILDKQGNPVYVQLPPPPGSRPAGPPRPS
jgi:hypothetical protein